MHLIDTNVAIHLRDRNFETLDRLLRLTSPPILSIISLIELEGGVVKDPSQEGRRRAALDSMLIGMTVLNFDRPAADTYRRIVEHVGYSRPKILDRMIAATALAHNLTLLTINVRDFQDIPGLKLESWAEPAQ